MITLKILNLDGSIYWVDYFNTIEAANMWLKEEKTRPYWKASYTTTIIDNTPPPRAPTYKELRAKEYPPMTDYLDAIVKDDQSQIQAYITACLAVKQKYPKT